MKKKVFVVLFILFSFVFLNAEDTGDTPVDNSASGGVVTDNVDDTKDTYIDRVRSSMGVSEKDSEEDEEAAAEQRVDIKIGYNSYFKIILTLLLVIGVIIIIFHFLKKALKIKGDFGDNAFILSNQSLGPGKWIQTVHVGGKYMVLGVTNENINFLTDITDEKEIERLEIFYNSKKVEKGATFSDQIKDFFENRFKDNSQVKEFDYESDSVQVLKEQNERLQRMKKPEDF